ncbi:MAG: hypothetical protein AAF458_08490 [Pseudomonadota bacterium]
MSDPSDRPAPSVSWPPWRLPREVQARPDAAAIVEQLRARLTPMWAGSETQLCEAPFTGTMRAALVDAALAKATVRGLEQVEQQLSAEAHGMALADARAGTTRGARLSRLLIVTSDAAERLYRRVATLSERHGGRLLTIRIQTDEETLGGLLYGTGHVARALLIADRRHTAAVLLGLAEAPDTPPG